MYEPLDRTLGTEVPINLICKTQRNYTSGLYESLFVAVLYGQLPQNLAVASALIQIKTLFLGMCSIPFYVGTTSSVTKHVWKDPWLASMSCAR